MRLTKKECEEKLHNRQLSIALIGMSGMGKSYRSAQLRGLGFETYCCDDEIAKRISSLLPSEDVSGLATWMGQPYAEGYKERERQYLKLEEEVTKVGLEARLPNASNLVLDTTGSVIYCSPSLLQKLKEKTLVVYLESNQEVRDKLFEVYMSDPKPVVWGDSFSREDGESDHDALKRCYPQLLEFRAGRYATLADVILPYHTARDESSSDRQFLDAIEGMLL